MRIPKVVRNILISAVVLLVVFVGGGFAYTYFMGGSSAQGEAALDTSANAVSSVSTIKPSKPARNAKEGVAVEAFMSPVTPGSGTSIDIRTQPTSKCTISVIYNNVASTDAALRPKIADDFGSVDWTWTVGASVPVGKWPVKVTCIYGGHTAVVQVDLQVAKKI